MYIICLLLDYFNSFIIRFLLYLFSYYYTCGYFAVIPIDSTVYEGMYVRHVPLE